MQELTPAPQSAAPSLGTPVPGFSGGLPAKAGLNVQNNPLSPALQSGAQQAAQHTQSFGRGDDTMLVHMTPNEVNSLRGLAQQFGGDLTQNPHTGLPEAGWLGKLLPTLLGGLGMAFGIPPVWMGALGAVGGTMATGDLGKGLMMGLQAYGGASLAGGLGVAGKISHNALGLMGTHGSGVAPGALSAGANAAKTVAGGLPNGVAVDGNIMKEGMMAGAKGALLPKGITIPENIMGQGMMAGAKGALLPAGVSVPGNVLSPMVSNGINAAGKTGLSGVLQGFGDSAKMGLPGGIVGKAAPMLAGMGLMSGVSDAMTRSGVKDPISGAIDNSYQGPYYSPQRKATFADNTQDLLSSSKERKYFDTSVPEVYNTRGQLVQPGELTAPGTPFLQSTFNPNAKKGQNMYSFAPATWQGNDTNSLAAPNRAQPRTLAEMLRFAAETSRNGYAEGGEVFHMQSGGHVIPAKAVAAYGNFSTDAGQEKLAGLGGIPIRGPGDGVSDSIPARIDGGQEARVANGEVYFPPEAVKRIGGNDKLYAMMKRAEIAANKAKSGEKVRGLA